MIEYKYKKRENKFTENGHTMFEADVLQRLHRLADLEEQLKRGQLLPKHIVSDWLPIIGAGKDYLECALNNGWIKFDDGTVIRHNEDWVIATATHYKHP